MAYLRYRIEHLDGGFEPQMEYVAGNGDLTWFPLNADGYWTEPEAYSDGIVTKLSIMSREDAERAILRARKLNGEQVLSEVQDG